MKIESFKYEVMTIGLNNERYAGHRKGYYDAVEIPCPNPTYTGEQRFYEVYIPGYGMNVFGSSSLYDRKANKKYSGQKILF